VGGEVEVVCVGGGGGGWTFFYFSNLNCFVTVVSGLLRSEARGIWVHKFGLVSCTEHLLISCLLVHFCLQNIATGCRR